MTEVDVVVVGAGAMGSATAWWLARRGRDVVLLEQFEQGHARGSSHGGTRIFRFAYTELDYVRLAQAALPLWRELEDDAGRILLQTTGGLDHGDPAAVSAVAGALAAAGAPYQVLPAEEAVERWPGFRFDGPVVWSPDGGRCLADATVRALQDRAAHHGADVRFGTGAAAVEVLPAGDRVRVTAAHETWTAPVAVVTAGGWLPKLLSPFPFPSPSTSPPRSVGDLEHSVYKIPDRTTGLPVLRVTEEQWQHFDSVEPGVAERWPSFIHHRDPWIYGLYTPGEGVKVARHHVGPEVDPDRRAAEPDPAASERVVEYVREWLPGLDPEPVHAATCLYTTTPTEDFVLDRVGPLVIGSPCSGHGFKFTPVIGRILADLADGQPGPGGRFALP